MTQANLLALDGEDLSLTIKLHSDHYGFAKTINAMPLAQSEYEQACKNYPIVFIATNPEGTQLQSVVLCSFKPEENWFVDEHNSWASYCYIPAYAKCHPFQLGFDEHRQRPVVYVDKDYVGLNAPDGMAFFDNTGEPSSYLQQLSHALRTLQTELEQTQHWIMRLQAKGLLVQHTISLNSNDKTEQVAGVWVVDTDKLAELDDAELAQMYHNGTLALIEQHRLSLTNLQQVALRAPESA